MDDAVNSCTGITEQDLARLRRIELGMPIVADLSRADLFLYCRLTDHDAVAVAQAQPHSVSPVHSETWLGRQVSSAEKPVVLRALSHGRYTRGDMTLIPRGAPVMQEVHPIFGVDDKTVIGVLSIETNLIERERHLRRREPFQTAVRLLQYMLLEGWLEGAEHLTPFGEHDGALVIDAQHRLTYISGVATNLYRKLGYMGELVGERISNLETDDDAFLLRVLNERKCIEDEVKEQQRIWIKKGIPLLATSPHAPFELRLKTLLPLGGERSRLVGVIMTVHDQTDERLREQELNIKSTMIQEIHHRVKNNLQTIAALLRLQARRVTSPEAEQVLQESINRILSVAVVHEFLSRRDSNVINFRDVSSRIIGQIQQGLLDPDKTIRLELNGPSIYLPPQQTTACALVVNELVQNSIEHGFENKASGTIAINLIDHGDAVSIEVVDDGGGLPVNFDLGHDVSLGLRIVQTLATDDLKGRFELKSSGAGTAAAVVFPKTAIGGGT